MTIVQVQLPRKKKIERTCLGFYINNKKSSYTLQKLEVYCPRMTKHKICNTITHYMMCSCFTFFILCYHIGMLKKFVHFRIPERWQILFHFARSFHQAQSLDLWRVICCWKKKKNIKRLKPSVINCDNSLCLTYLLAFQTWRLR